MTPIQWEGLRRVDDLDVLFEAQGLPAYDLPDELRAAYGGSLGFAGPRLVANFVATIDAVVAIPEVPRSTKLISAGSQADRFVLGLLRACADAMLLGSGTLHAHPTTAWTAQRAYPDGAAAFAELRERRGQAAGAAARRDDDERPPRP